MKRDTGPLRKEGKPKDVDLAIPEAASVVFFL